MGRSLVAAAVAIAALVACGSMVPLVQACSCLFTPIEDVDCNDFDLVFVASVIGESASPPPPASFSPIIGPSIPATQVSADQLGPISSSPIQLSPAPSSPFPGIPKKNIFVEVVECIKDKKDVLPDVGDIATLITPISGATCGITLPVGETFIFFINTVTGQPFPINLCSTRYLLSSGFLSIIKRKCRACKGCVKPPSPIIGPASPILGTATADSFPLTAIDDVLVDSVKGNPCKDAKCPFQADAVCLPDCDCEPQFVLNDVLVTRKCDCPEIPDCLPPVCKVIKPLPISTSVKKPCPKIICATDQTPVCQFIPFKDCKDVLCPNPVLCFADPCEVTSCPLDPDAKCVANFCGGCNAIYIDKATKEITQCDFEKAEPCDDIAKFEFSFGLCDLLLGYAVVDGECKAISGCSTLGFPFFSSMEECKKACGCPHDNCCTKDPCEGTSCPSIPDAVCVADKCKCTFSYVFEGTVVDDLCKDDCQFPSDDCPELVPLPTPCFYTKAPQDINGCIFGCQVAICPTDNVPLCPFIPFPDCENEPCLPVSCFVDPCAVASCPATPNAFCISNYCGGCNAIFVDPLTGKVATC